MLVVFGLHSVADNYAYLLGSFGKALGLYMLGHKVMKTVGKKVVKLDFVKGFAAQFSTAFSVMLSTIFGLPLSTTQCAVGSLFGIILAKTLTMVKRVYQKDNFEGRVMAVKAFRGIKTDASDGTLV